MQPTPPGPASPCDSRATWPSGSRPSEFGAACSFRGRTSVLRTVLGRRFRDSCHGRRRPMPGSPRRWPSGEAGSIGRARSITPGGPCWSVRPLRSKASPTCRRVPPWPRSPHHFRKPQAASATGTTDTRGLRDTTFTLQALHMLQLDWEADEFMQFVADVEPTEDGSLQIMYGIDGRRDLTESTRDDLSGYASARPVRIGNGAFDQRQNDVFGAVLDSVLLHTRQSERLPRRLWPIVQTQAGCAEKVWEQPDQGIWEARGAPQHYVSSKLTVPGGHGSGRQARRDPRRPRTGDVLAEDRRRDPG